MEYYSSIKNNEFMKFLGKWMELEAIILSDITQSQKSTHIIGYYHPSQPKEAWNTQETMHRTYEAHKEGRQECGCLSP